MAVSGVSAILNAAKDASPPAIATIRGGVIKSPMPRRTWQPSAIFCFSRPCSATVTSPSVRSVIDKAANCKCRPTPHCFGNYFAPSSKAPSNPSSRSLGAEIVQRVTEAINESVENFLVQALHIKPDQINFDLKAEQMGYI